MALGSSAPTSSSRKLGKKVLQDAGIEADRAKQATTAAEVRDVADPATTAAGQVAQSGQGEAARMMMSGGREGRSQDLSTNIQKGVQDATLQAGVGARQLVDEVKATQLASSRDRIMREKESVRARNTALAGAALSAIGGVGATVGTAAVLAGRSDIRLKKNITPLGKSPSGINIYKFQYLDGDQFYQGAMAQDLIETNPEAVTVMPNGFFGVFYDLIDVDFKEVDE